MPRDASNLAQFATVTDALKKLELLRAAIPKAYDLAYAEFGAYMLYSRYLEEGTKNKDGSVRMQARPHMLPAIVNNADLILSQAADGIMTVVDRVWEGKQGSIGATAAFEISKQISNAWVRVLNDKPRRDAVDRAPYEFGFHKRSIRGYSSPRKESDINTRD